MLDKKAIILETALKLFVTEGVTVPTARIAKDAGVANGTLFNYFPSKQDLMDAIYLDIKSDFNVIFETVKSAGSLENSLSVLWKEYVSWAIANPNKHKGKLLLKTALCISTPTATQTDANLKWLNDVLEKGIKDKEIIDIDMAYFMEILGGMGDASFKYAVANELKGKELETHINKGFQILWHGIRL